MNRMTGVDGADALAILGPDETELVRALDGLFRGWGVAEGATEISAPPLYPVSDLEKFDVYLNFPQLALVAGTLDPHGAKPVGGRFGGPDLRDVAYGLPHATCFGVYLYHEGTRVAPSTVVTMVNRCFRNEDHYGGLRRLAAFQMREIVALGSFDHTQHVIARFTERVEEFGAALGLSLDKDAAVDPFFAVDGPRALMQRVSPVKHEFRHGDLAIASVNTHRNFFGERCDIRLDGTGEHAYTGCVAFGLERWLAVLVDLHGGDVRSALAAVERAG
jgi:seryl-tRNA synthetase